MKDVQPAADIMNEMIDGAIAIMRSNVGIISKKFSVNRPCDCNAYRRGSFIVIFHMQGKSCVHHALEEAKKTL